MTPGAETETERPLPDLRERQATTAAVLSRCQQMTELEDGYALEFPKTGSWSEKLDSFTRSWRKSCPQMTFAVVSQPSDKNLVLHIRGPEGTKAFVEGARYMLTSHINPAPSVGFKLRHALRYATSPLRVLPDFVVVGAKKCGTTALYSYLTQHPRIVPAFKKEIYYFNAYYGRGKAWYRTFFPTRAEHAGGKLTGEATPDYLFHPFAPKRIQETIPNARFFAILRNPIDRAYSFYNHNLRAALEDLSFEEAIDREEERLAGEHEKVIANPDYFSFEYMHHSYKLRGYYVEQLAEWTKLFPKEQICVLATEALYERGEATLKKAFGFLGLPYHAPKAFKKLNAAPYYPEMDPKTRARLAAHFAPYNQKLYEFLGEDLGW